MTAAAPEGASGVAAPAGVYRVDPVHTFAEFSVKHLVVGRVDGRFNAIEGTFVVIDEPTRPFERVDVRMDAGSIDTQVEARDEDLRGSRFLDASAFPFLAFAGETTERTGATSWVVRGDLMIRDVTRNVRFDVVLRGTTVDSRGNTKIGVRATAALTRLDFGLTTELEKESGDYGGDDVEILLDIEATLQEAG